MDVEISLCDFVLFLLGISLAMHITFFVKNFDFLRHSHFLKRFSDKKNLLRNSNDWLKNSDDWLSGKNDTGFPEPM